MPFFYNADEIIEYSVEKRKRKTIGITIDSCGKVVVISPPHVSDEYIDMVVKQKSGWITNKLKRIRELKKDFVKLNFADGETLLYLGREYTLKIQYVQTEKESAKISGDCILVMADEINNVEDTKKVVKDILVDWYKSEAAKVLNERTDIYSKILNLYPQKISIRAQKRIWGSCSGKNALSYNYKLVMAPVKVVDYVVVHELCHIKYKNHSKAYWEMVGDFIPDYKERRAWLRDNGLRFEAVE